MDSSPSNSGRNALKEIKKKEIFYEFDPENVRFHEDKSLSGGGNRIGTTINLSYRHNNDNYQLILAPETMFFSFGIREDNYAGKATGTYSMCIVLDEKD